MADFATPLDAHMAVITLAGETLRGRPLAVREVSFVFTLKAYRTGQTNFPWCFSKPI